MTGIELLETVRPQAPDLPVIVITAHVTVDNAVGALRGRADEFLRKPLYPDTLIQTVTSLLARNRAAHERSWPSARTPTTSRSAPPAPCSRTAPPGTRSPSSR